MFMTRADRSSGAEDVAVMRGDVRDPAVAEDDPVRAGYGACAYPGGCNCPAYVQQYGNDLCGNCGHKYSDHW